MIEVVNEVTGEIADVLPRLVRQLSASAPPLRREDLEGVVSSDASRLLVARDAAGQIVGVLTLVVLPVDLTSRPSRTAANALYQREGFVQPETHVYRCTL